MKFLSDSYKYWVILCTLLLIFNLFVRDKLVNFIFNTSDEESVTYADTYANENAFRDFFVKLGFISLFVLLVVSILLLSNNDKNQKVNKLFVSIVLIFIVLLFVILFSIPNL